LNWHNEKDISMKKRRITLVVSLLALSGFLMQQPARASGIPTVDVASLVQEIIAQAQRMDDLAEQLYQSKVVANQYVKKVEELYQMYVEYDHLLNQMEGLKGYIDEDEWDLYSKMINISFPLDPFDEYWDKPSAIRPESRDENVMAADAKVGAKYQRMRELDEVYADIDATFTDESVREREKQKALKIYEASREAVEQKYSTERFTQQSKYLGESLETIKDRRKNIATKSESQLKTLQIMSMQNELELEYLKTQNEVLIKSLDLANQEIIERKNRKSYIHDMQLQAIKKQKEKGQYQPTDRESSVNF
tara:strand:- start:13081 stop:14001 length:921 start_codon:yes stop_codon:yes gene_type:complete